jgi:hypothetical protein
MACETYLGILNRHITFHTSTAGLMTFVKFQTAFTSSISQKTFSVLSIASLIARAVATNSLGLATRRKNKKPGHQQQNKNSKHETAHTYLPEASWQQL